MSGYLTSTRSRSVNKNLNWDCVYGSKSSPQHRSDPMTRAEYLMTYRSGDRFSADINGGAVLVPGTYLLDERIRSLGDYGHNFDHRKVDINVSHPRADFDYGQGNTSHFRGPLILGAGTVQSFMPDSDNTSKLGKSQAEMDVAGAGAIAKAYPTKPQADLLVGIAELLREGLPSAVFGAITRRGGNSGRQLVRDLSGDWLNYLFGITPLVREIDKLIKAVENVDQYMAQLVADSGNVVRRSRTVEDKVEVRVNVSLTDRPYIYVADYDLLNPLDSAIPMTYYQTLSTRTWFSGAFQYWIPQNYNEVPDSSSLGVSFASPRDLDIRSGIYGLRTTPKAVWNLLPFSWLVDWFVNVSDLFENADAMNRFGLVMPYGYVMCESKLVSTVTANFSRSSKAEVRHLGSASSMTVATRQQRVRATPYGFGLKDVDLNPVQWSILAALGLSTGKR